MSAITTLFLTMMLAVSGASTNANSSEASETPPSRIAINHNETMLGSSMAVGQAYSWTDLLTTIQAFFGSRPTSGGCDDWGCGTNHNETMLGSSLAIGQAYTLTDLWASIQSMLRPGGGGSDDWGCGSNHNETMLTVR